MLKNIDPLLSPELLKVLAEMGHGDAVVLVDADFTAASLAQGIVQTGEFQTYANFLFRKGVPGAAPEC
jgi:L-fucose mutarotase/ribose pyranase (RbsD/FucU family)